MKFLILSRNRFLYSTRRIIKAARRRGHDVDLLNPLACGLVIADGTSRILARGRAPLETDVVVPRIAPTITDYGLAVVSHFESAGLPTINSRDAIALARDKLRALQRLAAVGLPVPRTVALHDASQVEAALDAVGGAPAIVKAFQGSQGVGVMLLDGVASVTSVLETLWSVGQNVFVQQFVAESAGRDIRVLVVGGQVVTAMRRVGPRGEFRSNIHRGGVGEPIELSHELIELSEQAVAAIGLDVAGVDILETDAGPMILELNAAPGFEGIEAATGVDLGDRLVRFAETRTKSPSTRARAAAARRRSLVHSDGPTA